MKKLNLITRIMLLATVESSYFIAYSTNNRLPSPITPNASSNISNLTRSDYTQTSKAAITSAASKVGKTMYNMPGKIKQSAIDFNTNFQENLHEQMGEGADLVQQNAPLTFSRAKKIAYHTPGALVETLGGHGDFITGQTNSLSSITQNAYTKFKAAGNSARASIESAHTLIVENLKFLQIPNTSITAMTNELQNIQSRAAAMLRSAGSNTAAGFNAVSQWISQQVSNLTKGKQNKTNNQLLPFDDDL